MHRIKCKLAKTQGLSAEKSVFYPQKRMLHQIKVQKTAKGDPEKACVRAQSCPTLCDTMDCSLPGFSVYGIFQARVLEWGAISRMKSQPDWIGKEWA